MISLRLRLHVVRTQRISTKSSHDRVSVYSDILGSGPFGVRLDHVYTRSGPERTSEVDQFCLVFTLTRYFVEPLQVESFVRAAAPLFEYFYIIRNQIERKKTFH